MKKLLAGAGAMILAAAFAGIVRASDDVVVTGFVSDSMCGLDHADMQAKHGGAAQFSDAACTKACVEGGAKYVLADREGHRTYNLKDQRDGEVRADSASRSRETSRATCSIRREVTLMP